MDAKEVAGIVMGVISLFFLLLPVCWYLYIVIVPPPPSWYEYMPPMAGSLILLFFLGSNTLGIIFVCSTKSLLKRSTVFGVLFISTGLLNFILMTRMFYFLGPFGLLFYAPSIVTILAGLFLI